MALNIKNTEVERLVDEVVGITGETKTEAVRKALADRRRRLGLAVRDPVRRTRAARFLEREVWARIPAEQLGRAPGKEEREAILGLGPDGT